LLKLRDPHKSLKGQLQEVEASFQKKSGMNHRIQEELDKYEAQITPENKDDVAMLRSLLILNESLKKQEEQFRANCKAQLAALKEKIAELQNEIPSEDELERIGVIRDSYAKELDRLQKIKAALAKRIRDIKLIERKIDEIPSRSELQQYQMQFLELYDQVAGKLIETRKYYNTYNILDDTRDFLAKEIGILNSVNNLYKTAMKAKDTKAKLVEELSKILNNVDGYIKKTQTSWDNETENLRKVTENYLALVERERTYHQNVKDFAEECRKNEKLRSRLGL